MCVCVFVPRDISVDIVYVHKNMSINIHMYAHICLYMERETKTMQKQG